MTTGLDTFDTSLQKTNTILESVQSAFGWDDRRDQAYAAVRTVLHAVRDRLPVEASVNFSSQLTLLLKGVYFDGWNPSAVPIKKSQQEFIDDIAAEFQLSVDGGTERLIKDVMNVIFESMSKEEADKVKGILPEEIAELL